MPKAGFRGKHDMTLANSSGGHNENLLFPTASIPNRTDITGWVEACCGRMPATSSSAALGRVTPRLPA